MANDTDQTTPRRRRARGGRRRRATAIETPPSAVASATRAAPNSEAGVTQALRSGRVREAAPTRRRAAGSNFSRGERDAQRARFVDAGQTEDNLVGELEAMTGLFGGKPRQTLPVNANVLGRLPWAFLPRRQYQSVDLTTLEDGEFNAQQMLDLLVDAWPEMGMALWNITRLAMTGWKFEVRTPDNADEDTQGKELLDGFISRINKDWGGFEALLTQWVISTAIQGACAGETVPAETLDGPDDLIAVQPWTIYFQRDVDQAYIAFQWQPMLASSGMPPDGVYAPQPGDGTGASADPPKLNPHLPAPDVAELLTMRALSHGGFRQLNELTFGYVPLDADIDDPYGRMPLAPVLQLIQFDAQLLKDLRQWSHNNSWGRMDVSVVADKVLAMAPASVNADPKKKKAWLSRYLNDIVTQYNQLNPDDTFVHWDNVAVTGLSATGETFDIDNLFRLLERRIFRALKQLPILMGSNEGTTETWGTLQMEVYAQGIRSIQKVVASLVNKLLGVALRLYGHNGVVDFQFNELRSMARLQIAQAEAAEIANAAKKRDEGWIDQDEASIAITGSKAVKPGPDPDPLAAIGQPDAASGAPPAEVPPPGEQPGGKPGSDEAGQPAKPDDAKGDDAQSSEKGDATSSKADDTPDAKKSDDEKQDDKDAKDEKDGEQDDEKKSSKSSKSSSAKRAALAQVAQATRAVGDAAQPHTGVMTAFFLPEAAAAALADALPEYFAQSDAAEPAADYHLTLTYHGDTLADHLTDQDVDALRSVVEGYAERAAPLTGTISGVGRFTPAGAETHPLYASLDVPGLAAWRAGLLDALAEAGLPDRIAARTTFEYTPHITLAYLPADMPTPISTLPPIQMRFGALTLAHGGVRERFPLRGDADGGDDDPEPDGGDGDRALLAEAMSRTLATVAVRSGSESDKPQHSAARVAEQTALRDELRDYLDAQTLDRTLLDRIVDSHRSRAIANSPQLMPDLADALRVCADRYDAVQGPPERDDGHTHTLSPEQRAALLASIAVMLRQAFPDVADDLERLLKTRRQQAWNIAGQEALERVGLSGTFSLTNATLLHKLADAVRSRVTQLQTTTRDRLAGVIVRGLEDGATAAAVSEAVDEELASMAESRAESIAATETASAWTDAGLETWARNGIPYKAWRTGDDPDPGSRRRQPCRDNAYASPIPIWDTFPGGVNGPPQHPNCICDLEPSGDPSDAALANPWLGG